MTGTVDLIQNSEAWLQFRKHKIGSSTAPIIMGASPYKTARALYREWMGLDEEIPVTNFAAQKGHDVEPIARARYCLFYGREMLKDQVYQKPDVPWMIASLDGYNPEEKIILEIKCCGREVMEMAKSGQVHGMYIWQLEHQLMVTEAEMVHFYCVHADRDNEGKWQITDEAMVEYRSNPELREELVKAEIEFMERIQTQTEPPLTCKDTLLRHEPDVVPVWREMRRLRDQLDELQKKKDALEDELAPLKLKAIEMMKHTKEMCEGLTLMKQERQTVDTAALVGSGVDVQPFKKTTVSYVLRRT